MSLQFKESIRFLFFIILGGGLLLFAFQGQDLDSLIIQIKQIDYNWVALSVFFAFLAFVLRALRWKILIESLGYDTKLRNVFTSMMIGYWANLAFPRLGEVTRCASLSKVEKKSVDKLFGTVVVERSIDLLTIVALLGVTLFFESEKINTFLKDGIIYPISNKIGANIILYSALMVGGVVGIFFIWLWKEKYKESNKTGGLLFKFFSLIYGIISGINSIFRLKNVSGFIKLTIGLWLCYFLNVYIMFFALPGTSSLSFVEGLFILSVGSLGMVVPVQGGIGAFHWAVTQGLLLYGITINDGLAYATVSHGATTILIIVMGLFSFLYVFFMTRTSAEKVDVEEIAVLPKEEESHNVENVEKIVEIKDTIKDEYLLSESDTKNNAIQNNKQND